MLLHTASMCTRTHQTVHGPLDTITTLHYTILQEIAPNCNYSRACGHNRSSFSASKPSTLWVMSVIHMAYGCSALWGFQGKLCGTEPT